MTKDEALDLALEALEYFTDTSVSAMDHAMAEDAITAIKQARALDRMAENARELGLDYEPVPENFIDALKFDVAMRDAAPVQGCDFCSHSLYAGTRCKHCGRETASQPAPVQEPVAWMDVDENGAMSSLRYWPEPDNRNEVALYPAPPTQRTWVDLTNEEAIDIGTQCQWYDGDCERFDIIGFVRAIQAKLKEKNT